VKQLFEKVFYILPNKDPYKMGVMFLLMMVAAGLEVAGIGMIPAFVAIVADPDRILTYEPLLGLYGYLGIDNAESLLIWGSAALIGIFAIKSAYIIAFNFFEARFIYNRRYYISDRLMSAYMQAPYTFHLQRNSAELLRNVIYEINVLSNIIITNILKISREAVMTVSIIVFLFLVEPLITLLVLLLAGLGAGSFIMITQNKIRDYGEEEQRCRTNMIKSVNQGLGGIKAARVLNREDEFIRRFSSEALKSTRLLAYIKYIQQIPKPVVETTAVVGMMSISAIMVWQGRPMSAIIPTLTLFAMALVRLMPSVQQLSSLYTNFQYNKVVLDPIYDDLKELEEFQGRLMLDRSKGKELSFKNHIVLEDVKYVYPGSTEQALKGVSVTIPRGSAVAFVGESGAGKTTIVDVILGLLEPSVGRVLVDGADIHDRVSAWQRNLGYIPQTIYLADESLRQNIAFGVPEEEIDDEKVIEALELAQLGKLLKNLPEGLDTILGENGTKLSGGQRQRVGIARALYHNPEVLVMDEATSALDNITEKEISGAIENLKGDRTIIMIAHRLTTVQNCDHLYLMRDGLITDSGTFEELIEKNSEFKRMALVD
jgi:ATP-binding cassette, subfamily B, bacterial PglK